MRPSRCSGIIKSTIVGGVGWGGVEGIEVTADRKGPGLHTFTCPDTMAGSLEVNSITTIREPASSQTHHSEIEEPPKPKPIQVPFCTGNNYFWFYLLQPKVAT